MILSMKTKKYWKSTMMSRMELKTKIKWLNEAKENGYEKYYMKIKFDSDDGLSLNKPLKFFFRWRSVWVTYIKKARIR